VGHKRKIAVVGLGYVGLPVAVAFARSGASVIGFDIDASALMIFAAATTRRAKLHQMSLNNQRYAMKTIRAASPNPTSILLLYQRQSTARDDLI
jgi:UDP-N-acetyl-D-glucosamine/UDP-N-acetyl-D-galactosamine dehydrogenase